MKKGLIPFLCPAINSALADTQLIFEYLRRNLEVQPLFQTSTDVITNKFSNYAFRLSPVKNQINGPITVIESGLNIIFRFFIFNMQCSWLLKDSSFSNIYNSSKMEEHVQIKYGVFKSVSDDDMNSIKNMFSSSF